MPYRNERVTDAIQLRSDILTTRLNNGNRVKDETKFANILKSAINYVNNVEKEADIKTEQLMTNQINDLHDVMISAQKASLTIETAVQIQQKALDAYNEMMRMQV